MWWLSAKHKFHYRGERSELAFCQEGWDWTFGNGGGRAVRGHLLQLTIHTRKVWARFRWMQFIHLFSMHCIKKINTDSLIHASIQISWFVWISCFDYTGTIILAYIVLKWFLHAFPIRGDTCKLNVVPYDKYFVQQTLRSMQIYQDPLQAQFKKNACCVSKFWSSPVLNHILVFQNEHLHGPESVVHLMFLLADNFSALTNFLLSCRKFTHFYIVPAMPSKLCSLKQYVQYFYVFFNL